MKQNNNMTPEMEDQMIEMAYQNLLNGYLSSNHRKKVEIIDKAFKFARDAHKGIRRRSGDPYIMHPLAVATIVWSRTQTTLSRTSRHNSARRSPASWTD